MKQSAKFLLALTTVLALTACGGESSEPVAVEEAAPAAEVATVEEVAVEAAEGAMEEAPVAETVEMVDEAAAVVEEVPAAE